VSLDVEAALPGPAPLPTENVVHQVAELVEERHHLAILHQPRIARRAAGEVADQRPLGQLPSTYPRNQRSAREPLVLALARVHVEIDPAELLSLVRTRRVEDVKDIDRWVPGLRVRHFAKLDVKQARRRLQDACLYLVVGEVGPHALRVEV